LVSRCSSKRQAGASRHAWRTKQKSYDKLRKDLSQIEAPVELAERLNKALSEDALLNIRSEKSGPFIAPMRFFADQPEKTKKSLTPEERYPLRLGYQLDHYFQQRGPVQHLEIANAYFILEDEHIANLDEVIRNGGKVRILTNSLMATDVPMVHAAYAPNRRRLIDIGVDLWELRAYIVQKSASYGHEILGLHGKIMVVNNQYAIIGSANLDPRSRELNTEVALIIDHSDAADGMQELMNQLCSPEVSYQVTADPDSETGLIWRWIEAGEEQRTTDEPHRNAWRSLLQGTYHLMVPKSML
jgi:putative cardiolipin synthase